MYVQSNGKPDLRYAKKSVENSKSDELQCEGPSNSKSVQKLPNDVHKNRNSKNR